MRRLVSPSQYLNTRQPKGELFHTFELSFASALSERRSSGYEFDDGDSASTPIGDRPGIVGRP